MSSFTSNLLESLTVFNLSSPSQTDSNLLKLTQTLATVSMCLSIPVPLHCGYCLDCCRPSQVMYLNLCI